MGLFCFLKFVARIIDLFIWPLFAILYPLFISIWAIESNATATLLKLCRYWVLFSIFLLFEHLHSMLLRWFPFWPFFKFLFISLLLTSHFDGASSVYELIFYEFSTIKIFSNQLIKLKYQAGGAESYSTESYVMDVCNSNQDVRNFTYAEVIQNVASPPSIAPPPPVKSTPESSGSTEDVKNISFVEAIQKKDVSSSTPTLKSTSKAFQTNNPQMPAERSGIFSNGWCTLCNVQCNNKINMRSHFYGKKHSENSSSDLQETNKKPLSDKISSNFSEGWCTLCNVQCGNQTDMRSHFYGKKHSEKAGLWCVRCAIRCPNFESMLSHLNGSKHSWNVS